MSLNAFSFFLISLFAIPVVAQTPDKGNDDLVVFTVDKKPVTAAEFIYLYRKNHQLRQDEFTAQKIGEYLALFINFKLKVAEAQARGLDTTAAFRKEFSTYRDELRKPYLPDAHVIDSLVRLTYDRMKDEVNASHILVKVAPNATKEEERSAIERLMKLRNRVVSGEDFSTVASAASEDESARVNGGNLGYFTALQMVYPFESAAFSMKVGEISMPVRTQFGFHILKLNDRRPSRGEVEVAHILVRTGDNKDNEASKNLIFDIYDQLQKGVSWDELCREHSEDPSSRESGGKLRPFGVGVMSVIPEFEQNAFQLENPGDFSDPFETRFGWHIIKLIRKIPLAPFEEAAPSIRSKVARDERVQVSKQAAYDKMKQRYGYTRNEQTWDSMIAAADSTLTQGRWKPSMKPATLFTLNGKAYSTADFFTYVHTRQRPVSQDPAAYMEQLLNSFAEEKLVEVIEEGIIARSPEYKWLLKEYYEGILLFDIMEKEIWNRASTDSAGQVAFYDKNRQKYQAGERVDAALYSGTTRAHLDRVAKALQQKDTADVSEAVKSLKLRYERGEFEKKDRIILTKIPWSTGIHRGENNNLHYVVDVKKMVAPGPKSFEDARAEVISDYQAFLEQQWISQLRKKHRVKVNKKGKEAVFRQLQDEKTE